MFGEELVKMIRKDLGLSEFDTVGWRKDENGGIGLTFGDNLTFTDGIRAQAWALGYKSAVEMMKKAQEMQTKRIHRNKHVSLTHWERTGDTTQHDALR